MVQLTRASQPGAHRTERGAEIARARLVDALEARRIAVVEAGSGYGKSVLAAQYGRRLGVASAFAPLSAAASEPPALVGAIRRALRAARLSDLAAALEGTGDPSARVDSLLDALTSRDDPVLLVIDDAHAADERAAGLVLQLAHGLAGPHRLVVAARRLAGPLDRLRSIPGVVSLGTDELAFNAQEVAALFDGLGVSLNPDIARALREATAGWAAAVAMAAAATAAAPDPVLAANRLLDARVATPARLLDELFVQLAPRDRDGAAQLAHLPLLSPAVAAAVIGSPDAFERLSGAGIPLVRTATGWWEMPGPVAEHLVARTQLRPASARAAAGVYHEVGEDRAALHTLLQAGEQKRIAELLEAFAPQQIEELGSEEVATLVNALPSGVLAEHAGVLLHLARVAESTYHGTLRRDALRRADELARAGRLPATVRDELDAERARDLLWDESTRAEAEALAEAVVARAGADEPVARARALDVLGRARCWLLARGARQEAEPLLRESVRLSRRIGARTWAAQALVPLAWGVHSALCRYDRALATFEEALAELPVRNRYRAVVQSFRAEVLLELGRPIEAEAAIEEMREIGRTFGERWALAFAAWVEARLASYAGDRERTVRAVLEVESNRDEWYDQVGGLEFLAHAADLLDRVGEHELAREYLQRARERTDAVDRVVQLYTAMVAGRSGDAVRGRDLIDEMLARADLEPQEQWHLELLRAHAATRAGDPDAASLAAAAFERCLELGCPAAPAIREAAVAEALLEPAAGAGSRLARELIAGAGEMTITLLGGFELRRGGRQVALPPGRPAMAVRAVAAAGGDLHAEQLSELLWPQADPAAARNRLRNLLSRIRATAGPVLVRDGEHIALAPDIDVDATRFEAQGLEALALHAAGETGRATALARAALARYRGELLPGDRYATWATQPRERLRALALELLDVAAAEAERREEIDEAIRLLQRAITAEPHDVARYLRLARLLNSQGRAGSARATLARARSALEELGLDVPAELSAAEADI